MQRRKLENRTAGFVLLDHCHEIVDGFFGVHDLRGGYTRRIGRRRIRSAPLAHWAKTRD
jgi:hypothetical protein